MTPEMTPNESEMIIDPDDTTDEQEIIAQAEDQLIDYVMGGGVDVMMSYDEYHRLVDWTTEGDRSFTMDCDGKITVTDNLYNFTTEIETADDLPADKDLALLFSLKVEAVQDRLKSA